MASSNTWLPYKLGVPYYGRRTVISFVVCGSAALLNGIDLGIQGNTWTWIGFNIGFVFGFAWSALLLFGLSPFMRNFHPSTKTALRGASLFGALTLLAMICFQIWGQYCSATQRGQCQTSHEEKVCPAISYDEPDAGGVIAAPWLITLDNEPARVPGPPWTVRLDNEMANLSATRATPIFKHTSSVNSIPEIPVLEK
ncbi:MAG: hypothetical protein QOJ40_168 [Verrucomicrobiota bacterium]